MTTHIAFSDLRTAAYCPRKLYYQRTRDDHDREPPVTVDEIRALATQYDELLATPVDELATEPIARPPGTYRDRLAATRRRLETHDQWVRLCNPVDRDVLVTGRECRGVVHKVLSDPIEPAIVSPGKPPDQGVWEPQSVHAVAAAKALAWEHEMPVERAWVEYPAHGVIRWIDLTTRRKAAYRRTLRTVRELDGPPPRIDNRSKCESCTFAKKCGVRTRTLRSLLGFG